MTPKGTPDPEYPTSNSRKGDRKDKRNLIDVWLQAKPVRSILHYIICYIIFSNNCGDFDLCFRTRSHAMFGTGKILMK